MRSGCSCYCCLLCTGAAVTHRAYVGTAAQFLLNESTCERHLSSTLPGSPVTTTAAAAVSGTAVQDTGHITGMLARPEVLYVGKVASHTAVH